MDEKIVTDLLPFIILEIVDNAGGILDIDASSIKKRVEEESEVKLSVKIIDERLRIEVFDEDSVVE